MLANFFAKSKPITFVVLGLLFVVYLFLALFTGFDISFYFKNSIFSYFTFAVLLLLTFFFQNFIVVKNNLTFGNSYAFLFFILCLGLFPSSFLDEKTLIVNLLLLLFLRKVYSLQSSKNVFKKLFDGGLWLGISFLIEPFTLIFMFLLYGAIFIHKKTSLQTLLIPVVGFLTPLFLYFSYCFWYDALQDFYSLFIWFSYYDFENYKAINYIFPVSIIGLFGLISIFLKTPKTLSVKNTFRESWLVIILNLALTILFIIILKEHNGSEFLYLLFPIAIILANGLELVERTLIKEVLITVFFLCSLAVYFL
ncbi:MULTISPECIES: DUF6427 family protein [Tenacibaculum]|uniref:DUF6427 family protein n=1 Tax=Tenacibaculum TaxID=104267 RepID=UPI001F0A0579|nr:MULTISPECIES: DUF6427 family protein [Tenacibaculum]MCH3881209.1 DUF6427 family protein [Tenacibaculum aquimarinum]MDO6599197.1 DUF6427 family protein [Tenacibaculum sp. 1_MG-2023]